MCSAPKYPSPKAGKATAIMNEHISDKGTNIRYSQYYAWTRIPSPESTNQRA